MERVRLYRKEPNSPENSHKTRYRVATTGADFKVVFPDGTVRFPKGDYWTVYVEGEEELGAVYAGKWKDVLYRYDVVEDNLTESLPE